MVNEINIDAIPSKFVGNALFTDVYMRLKAMAGAHLSRSSGDSINTTALVHELYLRMSNANDLNFGDQAQFFDYAAKAMRHILIDRARARFRAKRGGSDAVKVELRTDSPSLGDVTAERALEIDSALQTLEREAPRAAHIVELHYFAGLELNEIAQQLKISIRTVNRDWRFARAYLHGLSI